VTAVTLSLFAFDTLLGRSWALGQMAVAPGRLRKIPDLGFFKLMGSGGGAGFSIRPNFGVFALLCEWPSSNVAAERIAESETIGRYREVADRHVIIHMTPISSRGEWSGHTLGAGGGGEAEHKPIAALTRATLRLRFLRDFWTRVPAISDAIGKEEAKLFMIGVGEIPWLHQVTFSIWNDAGAMRQFALDSPAHGEAVRRVRDEKWFSEQLFARFSIDRIEGEWPGLSGLDIRLSENANMPREAAE
jgi:spheroidene monooxygenase